MGLDDFEDETLIGGRDDQTLSSIWNMHKVNLKHNNAKTLNFSAK